MTDRASGSAGPSAGRDPGRPGWLSGRDGWPEQEPGRRLFIAVPVPEDVTRLVEDVVGRIRAEEGEAGAAAGRGGRSPQRVRWVSLDDLHLTIRFLGPTADERVEDLRQAVAAAAAGQPPFLVGIGGAGAFPSIERPRALWLSVADPSGGLARLAAAVARTLEAAGWPADDRPFNPHLTLARTDGVRAGPRVARRLVAAAASLESWFQVDRLVLYESHTGGGPARYEPLEAVPLEA